ncbi:Glucuronosyltransferase [Aphelenchoides besseyi]|nr:Glucuronosyltransferase [Aphelenchoides besseyi]
MLLNIFCSDILSNEEFLNELRSRKYDAAVSESYDSCSRFLFYKVGIPNVMGTSATALSEMMAHHLGLPMLGGFRPGKSKTTESLFIVSSLKQLSSITVGNDVYETSQKLLPTDEIYSRYISEIRRCLRPNWSITRFSDSN